MIDLELGTLDEAEKLLARLKQLLAGSGATVVKSPQAWIVEPIESSK